MCHFHNELFETLVLVSDIIINFFLISEGQMLLIEKKIQSSPSTQVVYKGGQEN
jgi:hypothetical protein